MAAKTAQAAQATTTAAASAPATTGDDNMIALYQPFRLNGMTIEELRELVNENLGNDSINVFDLERIKVPSGATPVFMIGGKAVEHIDCTLIVQHPVGAYYDTPFAEKSGKPPTCSSDDGVQGIGTPGGICAVCPKRTQFPAECPERFKLVLRRPGQFLPTLFILPFKSMKNWKKFRTTEIISKMQIYWKLMIRIGLEVGKSKDNIEYCQATFTVLGQIPEDALDEARAYKEAMAPIVQRIRVADAVAGNARDREEPEGGGASVDAARGAAATEEDVDPEEIDSAFGAGQEADDQDKA